MTFKGLYTALITPFDSSGHFDETVFRALLNKQIKAKIEGIVVLGSTGEAATLTITERKRVIEVAADEIKNRLDLVVGTGSNSTRQTIEWTKEAQELGATGALVVTPYYNRPTQEGLYRHFAAVAEKSSLPICLYNVPSRTGVNLDVVTLQRLTHFPSIVSLKEASGNIHQIQVILNTLQQHAPHFTILSGDDALTLPMMALGGHGLISVASNLLPKELKALVDACKNGDFKTALSYQNNLFSLFENCFIETNPAPIKAMMEICGMSVGECRLPLTPLLEENKSKLTALIRTLRPDV